MGTRIHADDLPGLRHRPLVGADGATLGTLEGFLVDRAGTVRYLEVRSGPLGTRRHAVPVADVTIEDGTVTAPFTTRQMRDAPGFGDGAVSDDVTAGDSGSGDDAARFLRLPLPPAA